MRRIVLNLVCITSVAHGSPAYWQNTAKLLYERIQKTSPETPYNKADFAAKLNEQNQENPRFIADFNRHIADIGVIVRKRALPDILISAAGFVSIVGGLAVIASKDSHAIPFETGSFIIGLAAVSACLAAGVCAYGQTSSYTNSMYQHRACVSRDPAEIMAITWAKHNTWATYFTSSKNSSNTLKHHDLITGIKRVMQEDPQFEKEFMDQVTAIGASAWNNKAISFRNSVKAAPWILPCGAIFGALIGAGLGKEDVPMPIKASAGGAIGALAATALAIPGSMLFGALDNIKDACSRIEEAEKMRYNNLNLSPAQAYATTAINMQYDVDLGTIALYGRKLKPTTTAHRAACWAKEHPWLTLSTLFSDKGARTVLHAETNCINPANCGL